MNNPTFQTGDKVGPNPVAFDFPYDQLCLNRNSIGQVVGVRSFGSKEPRITVNWNPNGKMQKGLHSPDQLVRIE